MTKLIVSFIVDSPDPISTDDQAEDFVGEMMAVARAGIALEYQRVLKNPATSAEQKVVRSAQLMKAQKFLLHANSNLAIRKAPHGQHFNELERGELMEGLR